MPGDGAASDFVASSLLGATDELLSTQETIEGLKRRVGDLRAQLLYLTGAQD